MSADFLIVIFFFSFICTLTSLTNVSIFDCDPSIIYPPVNQPGPSYTVRRANFSEHLKCYPGRKHKKRWILFLPGSTEDVKELYTWNWMPLMDNKGWSYCTLQLPEKGLGDLQMAAEYIVYAIRKMYKKATKEREKGKFRYSYFRLTQNTIITVYRIHFSR
jgi:hypothetical protein